MKNVLSSLTLAAALLALAPAAPALAQATPAATQDSPSKQVLDNSQRILATLEKRRPEFTRDRAALEQFVSGEFDAIFDRDYTARQVLGRHARGASDADVKVFADALATSLMKRYGSALLDFNTHLKVRIKSETALPRGLGVKVSSEMLREGGEPIPVDYLMRRSGDGWKVFDVMVEGVSFVQTFRQQFDGELTSKSIRQVAAELASGKVAVDAARAEGAGLDAAGLERSGDALRFSGALLRDAVPGLWRQALPLVAGARRFDLGAVTRVDSAGVALLAELAARAGVAPAFEGSPAGLAELRAAYRLQPDLAFATT